MQEFGDSDVATSVSEPVYSTPIASNHSDDSDSGLFFLTVKISHCF